MSKCKICDTEYYSGDEIDPEEPCWCKEMNNKGYYDFHTFMIYIRLKMFSKLYKMLELLIPKELKGERYP
jgi:hypothetical protein